MKTSHLIQIIIFIPKSILLGIHQEGVRRSPPCGRVNDCVRRVLPRTSTPFQSCFNLRHWHGPRISCWDRRRAPVVATAASIFLHILYVTLTRSWQFSTQNLHSVVNGMITQSACILLGPILTIPLQPDKRRLPGGSTLPINSGVKGESILFQKARQWEGRVTTVLSQLLIHWLLNFNYRCHTGL